MKKEVARERLLCTSPTFSQCRMVSVGISKLGCTDLVFVDQGVDQRRILPRRTPVKAATTRYARGIRGILCLSIGQRPSTSRARDTATAPAGNASVHSNGSFHSDLHHHYHIVEYLPSFWKFCEFHTV